MTNGVIGVVEIGNAAYPESLKNIFDPPKKLYYLGNFDALGKNIGIVGTREPTGNGKNITSEIVKNLVNKGFTIVSGLALGIDAVAHAAAIKNRGKTVAVLGAGVDIIYPRENTHLYNSILQSGGLILSEVPPGKLVPKEVFPARNRIISGLSGAIIVTEAGNKSGTMITVRLALEQGKEVFVFPGSPGADYLIKQGATKLDY